MIIRAGRHHLITVSARNIVGGEPGKALVRHSRLLVLKPMCFEENSTT